MATDPMRPQHPYPKDIRRRFWTKVNKTDSCWLWTGAKNSAGYGKLYITRYWRMTAHRLSWAITNGPIPKGMCVLHHCDTPLCIRPSHLFLGTVADNNHDAWRKGRHIPTPGEKHGHASITDAMVRGIVFLKGMAYQKEIAERYGVGQQHVSDIHLGKRWSHVTGIVSPSLRRIPK